MGKYDALLLRLAPQSRSNLPAMLAARRAIIDQPMVPAVGAVNKLVPDALVARSPELQRVIDAPSAAIDQWSSKAIQNAAERGAAPIVESRWAGTFADNADPIAQDWVGVASYPHGVPNAAAAREVRRHEIMHGYNHAARRGFEGLPFWSRVVGNAPGAIARPLDELIAQRAGGAGFMDIPWDSYARTYASDGSPGAARVARVLQAAQAARRAADDPTVRQVALGVGVGTGATLGAAYAYGALYPDEEERPAPEAIAAQFDRQVDVLRRRRPD